MSWNAATSGCEFNVMSSLTRFPDVALPLLPRPIDAYVECTFVTNIFSLYEKTLGSDDREDTASRWHTGSRRPSNALNDLCKALSDPVVLSSEGPWLPDRGSHQQPKLLDPRRP
ncbi:hypothetical protein EV363DRAFT_1279784 [Boletus edulis]|nr:hypothetical protein EV363DRAFT_1279784 [Boletus edulis]